MELLKKRWREPLWRRQAGRCIRSDFCCNVYKNCFNYELTGSPHKVRPLTWNVEKGSLPATFEKSIAKAPRMNMILGVCPEKTKKRRFVRSVSFLFLF